MPSKDGDAAVTAVAWNNKIYVTSEFGGPEDDFVLSYDLDTNTWKDVTKDMNFGWIGPHSNYVVNLKGMLYAIGGHFDKNNKVYNPDSKTWKILDHQLEGANGRARGACTMLKYALLYLLFSKMGNIKRLDKMK